MRFNVEPKTIYPHTRNINKIKSRSNPNPKMSMMMIAMMTIMKSPEVPLSEV